MNAAAALDLLDVLDWITYLVTKALLIYLGIHALRVILAGRFFETWSQYLVLLALAVIGLCGAAAGFIRWGG